MKCNVLVLLVALAVSMAFATIGSGSELPTWAVTYGGEFWRRPAASGAIDFGDVIERVSLAMTTDDHGRPCVKTRAYTARFDDDGMKFSASGADVPPADAALVTTAIRLGDEILCRPGALDWVALGNTAQARLDPDATLIQHCEATPGGVEVTWILRRAPGANQALTIEADVGGLAPAAATEGGHHFADAAGRARVRVGNAAAVDSAGRRWELATRADGPRLSILVPAGVLASATYPLAIDPAVSAELGMDNLLVSAPANSDQWAVRSVWGGTNYFVVWYDNRASDWSDYEYNIFGTRVSAAGQIVDPYGIAICVKPGAQIEPSAGWNGTSYYAAWDDRRNGTNTLIYGARVGTDGSVLDPDGVLIGSTPTNRNQNFPRIGSRTGSVLVVWQDLRSGNSDVYGRLVDVGGVPVGSSDFYICNQTNNQHTPAVAWGVTNFLVAWEDYRNDHDDWDYTDIYGARVTPDGTLMDTSSLAIGYFLGTWQREPTVAWGETNFLVAWQDSRNTWYDIYGARVNSGGQLIDPSHFAVCNFASNQTDPSVTWGGTNFFVAWTDWRRGATTDIYGARVSNAGRSLDTNGLPINIVGDSKSRPWAAWNGSQLLVSWQMYDRSVNLTHIYGGRVTETGGVLDAAGFMLSKGGNNQWVPDAAWGSTNWLVVWRDNLDETKSDIYGARVGSAGAVLDPAGIAICTATNKQRDPAVAWGGTNFLVVWSDDRNLASNAQESADLYGARVSSAGQVIDANGIILSTNLAPQNLPDVASDSTGLFLAVWQDYLTATNAPIYYTDIGGTRINGAGTVLDPGYSLILISTATNNQEAPVIAAGPTNFLVAWHDRRNGRQYSIYAARVDSARNVLDPSAFPVGCSTTNSLDPAVAWGGTNFLVAWEDYRYSSQYWSDIYFGRVSSAGVALDGTGGVAVCTETNIQSAPAVGWSGTNYLVVWLNENPEPNSLFGSRIDSGGRILDGIDPGGFELFTNRVRRVQPALAPRSNGLFLVTYSKFRTEGYNSFRIFSALLDLAPPALTVVAPHGTSDPSVGTNFYVHGTPVSCTLLDSPVTSGDTQWLCRGWAGTGNAPASGTDTNTGSFALDNDSTVTWLWTTNYRLAVAINGIGSANWTNGWVPFASNASVTASSGAHFYFNGWQGDVPAGSTNNNPVTLAMTQPRLAMPNFAPFLTSNDVPHWWLADHGLATNDAATMQDPDSDGQWTWEEYVADTDPTNRASGFVAFSGSRIEPQVTVTISATLTDRVYGVLRGTNFSGGTDAWTACSANVAGTGSNLTFVITNGAARGLYRFSVSKP